MPDLHETKGTLIYIFSESPKKAGQQSVPILYNCLGDLMIVVEFLLEAVRTLS